MLLRKDFEEYKDFATCDDTRMKLEGDSILEMRRILTKAVSYYAHAQFEKARIKNWKDCIWDQLQEPTRDASNAITEKGMTNARAKVKADLTVNEQNEAQGGVTRREIEYLCDVLSNVRVAAKANIEGRKAERFGAEDGDEYPEGSHA